MTSKRYSMIVSYAKIVLVYFLAFALVYLLFPYYSSKHSMLDVLLADIIATIVVFGFSIVFNNSSVYDPYWSVIPPIIVIYLMKLHPEGNILRQSIILALVSFWSIRLTLNWFRGWSGFKHEDWRYGAIAEKTGKLYWLVSFMGIHLMPTIFVFLGCLPLWYALSSHEPLNIYDGIAALFTLLAIIVEWLADEQLKVFKKKKNDETYIKSGLWALSRHPNYLGEICFWAGIFLFALSSSTLTSNSYWTIVGLVVMIILFKYISIPMMEKRNLMRKPDYQNYINTVPGLMPRLLSKSKNL